ncbi:MAG: hypothetical protein HY650_02135 [Acidobacteria bacterium]|nr:hypothetical protein [Acidobacteriota bacterium]
MAELARMTGWSPRQLERQFQAGVGLAPKTLSRIIRISGSTGDAQTKDLSALEWMTGTWTGTQNGVEMEELWMPAKGNTMLALHRDVAGGRTVSFEFLRIEASKGEIVYWASPMGRPATPFKLVEVAGQRAVFENPNHDFPQRIIYWIGREGSLHARIEGPRAGKTASMEWAWRRAAKS